MDHHFRIEDAVKYGTDKAVLLYNLRFWLEKNRANSKHAYQSEKTGQVYYWTYNSSIAFAKLFPYMKERTIRQHLQELEDAGEIVSGEFNKAKYDRTKWYTMHEYIVRIGDVTEISADGVAESADGVTEICQPIPDINTDRKPNTSVSPEAKHDGSLSSPKSPPPEDYEDDEPRYVDTDEDGIPLVKKKKVADPDFNKMAAKMVVYFQTKCHDILGTAPVVSNSTFILRNARKRHSLTWADLQMVIDDWFDSKRKDEEKMNFSWVFSDNNLNQWRLSNK